VWEDQWLPNLNGHKILSPDTGINNVVCVKDLMQGQSLNWNQRIIDQELLEFERDMIKQLPIIHENVQDKLMWIYTKDGHYIVKSGYQIIKHWNWKDREREGMSNRINRGKCGTEFRS
jgi:hypothetical protein